MIPRDETAASGEVRVLSIISRLARLLGFGGGREADCAETRAAASDFVDGELDGGAASAISRHLAKCPLCAAFVRTLRATVEALRRTPRVEPPAGFADRLALRLAQERESGEMGGAAR